MRRAEKQAGKTERAGANESTSPDRTLSTVRSPSAERSGGITGQTLPVVEEAGEAGSTSGRSRDGSFRKDCDVQGFYSGIMSETRLSSEPVEMNPSKGSLVLDKPLPTIPTSSPPVSPVHSTALRKGREVEDLEVRVARVSEMTDH
jgi:1-phosphatidylinositol-4-phosphate 5-kinase